MRALRPLPPSLLFAFNSFKSLVPPLFKSLVQQDAATLPSSSHGVPLAPTEKARRHGSRTGSGSGSTTTSSGKSRIQLKNVTPMDPETMVLPPHLVEEVKSLAKNAKSDNPVTDRELRPLLKSTVIWLMQNGTINKEDSPGVIQRAGELLHDHLPQHLLRIPAGKMAPLGFAPRIFNFFNNHVTSKGRDFGLECAHDATLSTPMRALEDEGLLTRLPPGEDPPQGMSGKSIMGKRRTRTVPDPSPTSGNAASNSSDPPDGGDNDSGKAEPKVTTLTPVELAAAIKSMAEQGDLDVSISKAARGGATDSLPTASSGGSNTESHGQTGGQTGRSRGRGRGGGGKGRTGGGRSRGRGRGAETPAEQPAEDGGDDAAPPPPPVPAKRKQKQAPPPFQPEVEFAESSLAAREVIEEGELEEGSMIGYYLVVPQELGGVDWYAGEVSRITRGTWADVMFSDGKLWCSVKPTERGTRWVMLAA